MSGFSPVPVAVFAGLLLCANPLFAGSIGPSAPVFAAAGFRAMPVPPPAPVPRSLPRGPGPLGFPQSSGPGYAPIAVTYPQPEYEPPVQRSSVAAVPYALPVFALVTRSRNYGRGAGFYPVSYLPSGPRIIEIGDAPKRKYPKVSMETDPVVNGQRPNRQRRFNSPARAIISY